MQKRPFFWHIFPPFLIITIIASAVIILYVNHALRSLLYERTVEDLKTRAYLLKHQLQFAHMDSLIDIDSVAKFVGARTNTRLTMILPSGKVIADSDENPLQMDNHADRPEIRQALSGDTGIETRFSATLSRDLVYVAIPLMQSDTSSGVLRVSLPVIDMAQAISGTLSRILVTGLIVILLSILASVALSRRLSRPLEYLRMGAQRFARGDLTMRLAIPDTVESAQLAEAMNTMAQQLDERIRTITRQRNQQDAILAAMVEGVIAIDNDEHIIMVNNAATRMLGKEPMEIVHRWVQEAIRDVSLQRFIKTLLTERIPQQQEIVLHQNGTERELQVNGTMLRGSRGGIKGGLIVLHDVTTLKRLENIRKDFVANVSHELRTPLTSIKGFVETLLDGAMEERQERHRFLKIIANHVNRLNAIIEDLMTLSRLEKVDLDEKVHLETSSLDPIVRDAVTVCSAKASQQRISISIEGERGLTAVCNASLFEQALINLVDNAIKYSPPESHVRIGCTRLDGTISVSVTDQGPGIAQEHIPRLFERFYRIDKARSRKLGGTGLGLAIVKHIMHANNGSITVESELGKGSMFTLLLPTDHIVKSITKENA
ncbi:MAG: two-component system histidine kinase PnpS [Chitinispirillaceae bacterium]